MTKIKDERLKISLYSFFECFRHTPKPHPKKMPKDFFIVNLIECTIQKKFFLHENLRYSIFKKKNKITQPTAKMSENTLSLWIRSKISRQSHP